MRLEQLLFSQGFGTRRDCRRLARVGRVVVGGTPMDDPDGEVALAEGEAFEVEGTAWPFHAHAVVALHKPAGYECSAAPRDHPAALSLLPEPLRQRGVQTVGRLDADSSGILLLTDDGALLHRLTAPKRHVEKVYEVGVKHPVDARQLEALRTGVVLRDDPVPVRAVRAEATGERSLRLVLDAGKYHQVKRMLAAAGNRVETLHRTAFAGLALDGLPAGAWRWLGADERAALG